MAYQSEIEKLTNRWNENPDQYFAPLADAYRKSGDLDMALEVVRAGLQKRPNYLSAHIVLGRCLVDQQNDPEASKVFQHVLELDAENIIALRYLGEITERGGDPAGAQRWVKRLLEVDPMNDDAVEALKRLEAARPAPPPPPPTTPEVVAAKAPEPAPASGFRATAMAAGSPPTPAGGDFAIERSSDAFETAESKRPVKLEMPSDEVDLSGPSPRRLAQESQPLETVSRGSGSSLMLPLEQPPAAAKEPPAAPSEAEHAPARTSSSSWGPAQDLPLIMPDDVAPPTRSAPAADGVEPEPVITETMAEVYLKQGLVREARDVYRRLVQERPGDGALRARLASLDQRLASGRGIAPVAQGGGVSTRSLLGSVLLARPGAPAPGGPPPSAMDAAFAEEPVQSPGAPTRPTSDELSLAAVFGDESTPAPASPPPPPKSIADAAPVAARFPFDELFGGKPTGEKSPTPPPAPGASADPEGGTPDDFLSWLKGLKS